MSVISAAMMKAGGSTTALQGKLTALHSQLQAIQAIGSVGKAMFAGASELIDSTIEPAKEYNHQIVRMNMLGTSQVEIAKNVAAAWSTSHQIMTSGATEGLQSLQEMNSILNNWSESRALLPRLESFKAVMNAAAENYGSKISGEGMARQTLKFAE